MDQVSLDVPILLFARRFPHHRRPLRNPIANFRAMDDVISQSMGPRRFAVGLLAVFNGFAVVMAFVATSGLMSYIVAQRMKEFGFRMAFAARGSAILRLVMSQSLRIVLPGVAAGILVSMGLSRFLSTLFFEDHGNRSFYSRPAVDRADCGGARSRADSGPSRVAAQSRHIAECGSSPINSGAPEHLPTVGPPISLR